MKSNIRYSRRRTYFRIVLILFLCLLGGYIYLQVDIFLSNRNIDTQQNILEEQNKQLEVSQLMTGFNKLDAARQVEKEYTNIPWSEHIPKVIEMLEEIKNTDASESETIVLSDFKVSLDEVSLKGKVSKMRLLYYSRPEKRIEALLDKFTKLDFLEDIRIQSYEKDDNGFEFVLSAKVVNHDTK